MQFKFTNGQVMQLLKLADEVSSLRRGVPALPDAGFAYRDAFGAALQSVVASNGETLVELLTLLQAAVVE